VTEQSEHLSSAQIENYGNRSSGAGPDAEQRDEPQRGVDLHLNDQNFDDQRSSDLLSTDQLLEDQRVEAHLADCPSCRNRLLDFHRAHFALLAGVSAPGGTEAADSSGKELSLGDARRPADALLRTSSTPACPSDDDLRQLAAGLSLNDLATSDALVTKIIQHAATCDHCGPLLKTYTEDFSDDFTPVEQAAMANLQSSSAEWQKNTARQMLEAGSASAAAASAAKSDKKLSAERPASSAPSRKPFFWKWILVPATVAVVAMAAFSIWYTQRDTPEKVERLLVQAYTEPRTMEMRIAGASYSSLAPSKRGGAVKQPPVLFDAKSKILTHLKEHPDDGQWLHALGLEEMIERHADEAVTNLVHAFEVQPGSTAVMIDLASAYFQRARATQNSNDYRQAVELLGKVLAAEPNNPLALFNRAILYEEMSPPLYDLALQDWERYLAIDKYGPWRDEAQRRKSDLEQIKKKSP
jgi:cytochrome c-type biogenesis protein CcmH/NrfG